MTHDPNNKECEATCDSECNQAHTHFDENDCTCPPEKKEDWVVPKSGYWIEFLKEHSISESVHEIMTQISLARQEEREKMSTFLKEGEDHINALIALAESRARKEFDAMLAEDIAEIQKTIDILPQHKSAYESGVWVALTKAKSILEARRLSLKK